MPLLPEAKNCDISVKKNFRKISRVLGYTGTPSWVSINLTGLTASSLIGTDASKVLESVTIGTGLDYTRPTLSLSHLGIEDLTDPGADRIFFWDNSASASEWLAVGNSIAITTTTIDTIQDIRTSASPTFAGLTITNACVLGSDSAVFQPNTDSTTFFQVLDADGGTPVINIDTTNERFGVGTDAPGRKVSVVGVGNTYFQITNTTVGAGASNGLEIFSLTDGSGGILNRETGNLTIGSQGICRLNAEGHVYLNALGAGNHVYMNPGSGLVVFQEDSTTTAFYRSSLDFTQMILAIKDVVGNQFIITNDANSNLNHDHATQTNPTFYVHSDKSPNTDNTEWISLAHDQTNAIISWGSGALEFLQASPYINLHNTTHEDSDGGRESRLNFKGEQTGGEETTLARIEVGHDGSADDEKGYIDGYTNTGSDEDSPTKCFRFYANGTFSTLFGRILKTNRLTGNTTLDATHHQVFADTDGGAFTVTLPAGVAGTEYRIVNTGSSENNLTIAPDGAELLIGVNANWMLLDGEALMIVYEATEGWY